MENVLASVQRIIKNKNFVTIAGIIIALVLLYWGYSTQINKAVQPMSVPVAIDKIQPRTEITSDMVEMVDMPAISIGENVITSKNSVVGKYSNVNTVIPAGSMFYKESVIDENKLPDSVFIKVKKGEIVYSFKVDMESTYGNSIYPGNKIDIYMKTGNGTDEKVMLGKLVENVEVLAVKDASGQNVFENTDSASTPDMFIFGLPEDIYLLLKKASYMESLGVELYPVPHGGKVSTKGATEVSTQQLADYIEAHAVNIPVTKKETTDELKPTITQAKNQVTIKFKKGCGSKYTCTYSKNGGSAVVVKKTSQKVNFTESGTITASLTEKDGTVHATTENITVESATANTQNGVVSNATNNTTNSAAGY